MDAKAMEPFGRALLACLEGESGAELIVRRNDGKEATLPMSLYFRSEPDFTEMETRAMALCEGRVLDIGTGAGSQSIALQRRGHPVTAIDISPEAVAVARRRGAGDARCADILSFEGGPFDTLLMLGHGIGMVETIEGLKRFLARAPSLLATNGQLLLDSLDVRVTQDPADLAYHQVNRQAGSYIGEIRMQFEFQGRTGPYCGWLQVDAKTLSKHAESAGWRCEVVHQGENGNYLARLTRQKTVSEWIARAFEVFSKDAVSQPTVTLRGGDALDRYQAPPAFDPDIDAISDGYLEEYADGLTFLNAASWRHYLPHLMAYAARHAQEGSSVGDALLHNLRPPDREPPRLASLSPVQERAVTECLEFLAFSDLSAHQDFACQVLEEWWIPDALYRRTKA